MNSAQNRVFIIEIMLLRYHSKKWKKCSLIKDVKSNVCFWLPSKQTSRLENTSVTLFKSFKAQSFSKITNHSQSLYLKTQPDTLNTKLKKTIKLSSSNYLTTTKIVPSCTWVRNSSPTKWNRKLYKPDLSSPM